MEHRVGIASVKYGALQHETNYRGDSGQDKVFAAPQQLLGILL
jgi:hypothetical protein